MQRTLMDLNAKAHYCPLETVVFLPCVSFFPAVLRVTHTTAKAPERSDS